MPFIPTFKTQIVDSKKKKKEEDTTIDSTNSTQPCKRVMDITKCGRKFSNACFQITPGRVLFVESNGCDILPG